MVWAIYSKASLTLARLAGPPRQILTASGALPLATKASLATTPMPIERRCSTKAERVHSAGKGTQMLKLKGSAR